MAQAFIVDEPPFAAASIAVVQLVGVVAAGTVGEPHVAAAIGDELRVLHRRARHHYPSARVDVEPLGTRVRVVAEWPCRDDHALVVVAQVIDHEGRDAFVPLAVEAGTRAAEIGRAQVWTTLTNSQLRWRALL